MGLRSNKDPAFKQVQLYSFLSKRKAPEIGKVFYVCIDKTILTSPKPSLALVRDFNNLVTVVKCTSVSIF